MCAFSFEGETDVVVLIKAAPEIGRTHGETVCVAGIDRLGAWHRLYPVPYKDLLPNQRFSRWDIIRVRWRRPSTDDRVESKRIDPQTLRIVGSVPSREWPSFIERAEALSLEEEDRCGRSLALIRPESPRFLIRRLTLKELEKSQRRRDSLHAQADMFSNPEIPKEAPPYRFSFQFRHAGKTREHQCIDWETEQTFFKWRNKYGEAQALEFMKETWGHFDDHGLVFAMGTHRVKHWKTWLLSSLIRAPRTAQAQLIL